MSTHGFIDSYLEELKLLPKPVQVAQTLPPNPRLRARWVPPAPGFCKINVDVSVSRSKERGAATAFYRDSNGAYQGASSIVIHGVTGPLTLEAITCREALSLAEDLGVNRIYVASDCKVVIDDSAGGQTEDMVQSSWRTRTVQAGYRRRPSLLKGVFQILKHTT
jgi:hypothetical protein